MLDFGRRAMLVLPCNVCAHVQHNRLDPVGTEDADSEAPSLMSACVSAVRVWLGEHLASRYFLIAW